MEVQSSGVLALSELEKADKAIVADIWMGDHEIRCLWDNTGHVWELANESR